MPNVSPEAQTEASALRTLLEGQTVECFNAFHASSVHRGDECPDHCKQGRLPDPRVAGLLDVLTEVCEHDFGSVDGTVPTEYDGCNKCGTWYGIAMREPSLRNTRIWTSLPYGALKGSIEGGIEHCGSVDLYLAYNAKFRNDTSDCDLASLQSIREAVTT